MKVTLLYDNTVAPDANQGGLIGDWGFSAFIEYGEKKILFDTGAKGDLLLRNLDALGVMLEEFDMIFISHDHWDHVGGILHILERVPCILMYVPENYHSEHGKNTVYVRDPLKLSEGIFSTGQLSGIEQSLILSTPEGFVVLAGCSHPGVGRILEHASGHGRVRGIIGGLHGFSDYPSVKSLDFICPCHCTVHQKELFEAYPEKCMSGGVGRVFELR